MISGEIDYFSKAQAQIKSIHLSIGRVKSLLRQDSLETLRRGESLFTNASMTDWCEHQLKQLESLSIFITCAQEGKTCLDFINLSETIRIEDKEGV